jgi:restriction system protein
MPSRYPFQTTIRNEYLGVSKTIRAMSAQELTWLVHAQEQKWRDQEARKRELATAKAYHVSLKSQAEENTRDAQERVESFRRILLDGLKTNLAIDWDLLLDRAVFPEFAFNHLKPDRDLIRLELLGREPQETTLKAPVPEQPSVFEFFLPFLRTRRQERLVAAEEEFEHATKVMKAEYRKKLHAYRAREKEVVDAFNTQAREYNRLLKEAQARYTAARDDFLGKQNAHNQTILAFRSRYEEGSPEAVERYCQMALQKSGYPDGLTVDTEIQFDDPSKTVIISFALPGPADVPRIVEYKFVATRKEIKPVEMKAKEFDAFYDDVIHQIALRTAYEVFAADYAGKAEAIVFNGWVRGIDAKTGQPFVSCILSYQVSRDDLKKIDLAHVSPKECVRGLKGLTAGPLTMLAPVKPIMDLNKDDDRFVESRAVADQLSSQDNLAAMEWEDFEHLVRELFEREFASTGGEVRVTQASRDRGVDAIAFDPDPIRGGKFVIQAKRYNMVVPVSAVRDLYGTMISEGASKGILVTTSYFGRDSREFAKDKPITLLDGENLVFLFQKHGKNVHIALLPKGDPGRGARSGQ